jgi:hypothetical protein
VRGLRKRRTTIDPLFDLIARIIGTTAKQKQLPIQHLGNVRTCLALATFFPSNCDVRQQYLGSTFARHLYHVRCAYLRYAQHSVT